MKKIFLALAVCLAAGCTSKEEIAQAGAQNFLDAFLANDYEKAAGFCTDDFKVNFDRVTEDFRNLDTNVRALLVSECSQYTAKVVAAQNLNGSDTFKVGYKIIKAQASWDSIDNFITNTLTVVEGKVSRLGE